MASSSHCLLLHDPCYSLSSPSISISTPLLSQQQDHLLFLLQPQQHQQQQEIHTMVRKRPISDISDNPSPSPPPPPPPPPPPVCGFSGLPLFAPPPPPPPPDPSFTLDEGGGGAAGSSTSTGTATGLTASVAWVDGIIRDLINSAAPEVSVPQLIQNVREIIFPCNPTLANILETRLRNLVSDLILPTTTTTTTTNAITSLPPPQGEPSNKRRRESPLDDLQPPPPPPPPPNASSSKRSSASLDPSSSEEVVVTAAMTAAAALRERRTGEELVRKQKKDEEGLHLLTLLLQCAEAVAADNLEDANRMLLEISELSTPFGTSAQRVAAYFSEAMSARLVSSCLGIYSPLPSVPHRQKLASAFQVFNGISPFVKFSHFTSNQAIQEAFEREEHVHIIDLDIMQGLQWPGLFHILASRPGGPPRVRLTGLGSSMESLEATGKRLSDFAETLGLPFEFIPIAEKVGSLEPERLGVRRRGAVAVHWLHHSLYDVTGSDTSTLWLLQR